MLESIFSDVWSVLRATFFSGDIGAPIIAAISILIAAFMMRRGTQIGTMTLLALSLFALGGYLRGVAATAGDVTGGLLVGQLENSWGIFMGMTAATLLAYFIAFMVLILIVYGARALFSR